MNSTELNKHLASINEIMSITQVARKAIYDVRLKTAFPAFIEGQDNDTNFIAEHGELIESHLADAEHYMEEAMRISERIRTRFAKKNA